MANAHAVTLRIDMNLTEIHQEIAKLGNITNAPHTKVGLNSQGDEVLYVRKSSVADKLKRLVMSADARGESGKADGADQSGQPSRWH